MPPVLVTVGERVAIDASLSWVRDLIAEGAGGELRSTDDAEPTIRISVDAVRRPFEVHGWNLLTRGAWQRNGEVVIQNVCTSGFDLHFSLASGVPEFTYRWRPPLRDRAAARLLRSRFHLLARAALFQYPALWWAGTRGRAPLHASGATAGRSVAMLTAASGVGRSTLVLDEVAGGEQATGDNLAVGDGTTIWGLAEPVRVEGGSGRRMPHGRAEAPFAHRVESLVPDCVVVLERARSDRALLSACTTEAATRSLVTSTYMAGELRRYWPFAATLAAGTEIGPVHPPITQVASEFASTLPCLLLALRRRADSPLSELLEAMEVTA
jgi:hypothetical protein